MFGSTCVLALVRPSGDFSATFGTFADLTTHRFLDLLLRRRERGVYPARQASEARVAVEMSRKSRLVTTLSLRGHDIALMISRPLHSIALPFPFATLNFLNPCMPPSLWLQRRTLNVVMVTICLLTPQTEHHTRRAPGGGGTPFSLLIANAKPQR